MTDQIKPLSYAYSKEVLNLATNKLAQKENNDCVVKALAVSTGASYNEAHEFASEYLMRTDKQGTHLDTFTPNISGGEMLVGSKKVLFNKLSKKRITNRYKVKGEIFDRKKTIKSFIKDNTSGTFIVTVAGHALTVKNGMIIDNEGEEFRPTRKILGALQVEVTGSTGPVQLSLF
tara:strand:+ start:1985 stop:2509 length:525 start_codon:yes stop_codon:yes gene_type:complete